jgi:hypothetical protein
MHSAHGRSLVRQWHRPCTILIWEEIDTGRLGTFSAALLEEQIGEKISPFRLCGSNRETRNNAGATRPCRATSLTGRSGSRYADAMARRDLIAEKLTKAFALASLDVVDESDRHIGHAGHREGGGDSFQGAYCGGGVPREEPA